MDFNQWFQSFLQDALNFIPRLIVAIIVLVLTITIAKPFSRWVLKKSQTRIDDPAAGRLLSILAYWLVLITGVVVALGQVNFDVTGFVAGLGIAGLTIGFALQDITRNFVAGVILLVRKPYSLGDEVDIAGHKGTVTSINSRDTVIKSYDGELVILPNINIFNTAIINYTDLPHRRRTIRIGLGYGEDISRAASIFLDAVNSVEGVLKEPAASVLAEDLADSTVTLVARFWCNQKTHSLFKVHSAVVDAIKLAAGKEGIDTPHPVQTIRIEK